MDSLAKYLTVNKRGQIYYAIAATVPLVEKSELIEQFVSLHGERKYWGVRMHMTKRSMPFTIHGTISFRATSQSVNKLVVYFDQTAIGKNVDEVNLIWHHMQPHLLRVSPVPYR